jgi:hypothetical protein
MDVAELQRAVSAYVSRIENEIAALGLPLEPRLVLISASIFVLITALFGKSLI